MNEHFITPRALAKLIAANAGFDIIGVTVPTCGPPVAVIDGTPHIVRDKRMRPMVLAGSVISLILSVARDAGAEIEWREK